MTLLLFTAFITTLLNDAIVDLWVGLTSDAKGHFQWARPGLLSYTNWAPGEPLDNSGPHHNRTPVHNISLPTHVSGVSWLLFSSDKSMVRSQGNCVVMNHGNPLKSAGMWASRACEMENNGYICQRQQGVILIVTRPHWAIKGQTCDISVFSVDSDLPPAPPLIPASLSKPVELGRMTYRVVEKRLDWTGALHLCESLNGTLARVKNPHEQAYLTLLINSLRRPAWIALYSYGVSSLTFPIIHP